MDTAIQIAIDALRLANRANVRAIKALLVTQGPITPMIRRLPPGSSIQERIVAVITNAGGECSERDIYRSGSGGSGLKIQECKETLCWMVEDGTITVRKSKPQGGGRPSFIYAVVVKPLAVGDMKPEQERALLEIIRKLEEDKCALKRELDVLSAERELRRRPDGSNIKSRIIALITLHGGELRERVIARNFKHVMKTAEDRKAILREMVEAGTLTTRIGGKLRPGGWTEIVYSIA